MTGSWPGDPWQMDEWTRSWGDLFRPVSPGTEPVAPQMWPTDPFAPVVDALRDRLLGKERSLRVRDREVRFTVDDLVIESPDRLRSVGQYGEVRLTGRGVEWDDGRIERFEIRAQNVHVRPGGSPALVAAPVRLEAHVDPAQLSAWCARLARRLEVTFTSNGPQVGLAGRAPWARLDVSLHADGRAIRVVPRSLRLGSRSMRLRLPGYSVALRWLPPDVLLTDIDPSADDIVLYGLRTEWRWSLSRDAVQKLIASLRRGRGPVNT